MTLQLASQAVRIATFTEPEDGLLLFANGRLVAIISQLRNSVSDELAGRWFLEAGFGPCAHRAPEAFDTAGDAERWVRSCLEVEWAGLEVS
ncbi:hypothetical protein [Methylobacterium sp. ID0610]|uniref:hypothetical protein n=1 Tax=Methylobacterium carpenticola TaxID=3344827 RepID=UPI00367ED906